MKKNFQDLSVAQSQKVQHRERVLRAVADSMSFECQSGAGRACPNQAREQISASRARKPDSSSHQWFGVPGGLEIRRKLPALAPSLDGLAWNREWLLGSAREGKPLMGGIF